MVTKSASAWLTVVIHNSRLLLAAVDGQTDDLHLHKRINDLMDGKAARVLVSTVLSCDAALHVRQGKRNTENVCWFLCVLVCLYLSTVTQHGVWWFGQLLTTDDLQNELLLGIGRKRVVTEWIKWA